MALSESAKIVINEAIKLEQSKLRTLVDEIDGLTNRLAVLREKQEEARHQIDELLAPLNNTPTVDTAPITKKSKIESR